MNRVELANIIGLEYNGFDNGCIIDKEDIFELYEHTWSYIHKYFSCGIQIILDQNDINRLFKSEMTKDDITTEQLSQLIWELAADKYFEKLNSVMNKFD